MKTSIKDPSGKQSDNFMQFKLDYAKPNLDPDEGGDGGAVAKGGAADAKAVKKDVTKASKRLDSSSSST